MTSKKTVAVIGARGYVGTELMRVGNEMGFKMIPITREDSNLEKGRPAEHIVHAAMTGRRFWAEQNPRADFQQSVELTRKILAEFEGHKIVVISSISARTQLDRNYGRNRRAAELLAEVAGASVIRLGPMYGGSKKSGALYDLLKGRPVYVDGSSRYAYSSVEWNAQKILQNLTYKGILELGSKASIRLDEIKDLLGSQSPFEGPRDDQFPTSTLEDSPEITEFIKFALTEKRDFLHE